MTATTQAFLARVLQEDMNLRVGPEQLARDVLLGSTGLGLGSLELLELGMHAQSDLGVSIPDSDYERIGSFSVGEFLDYLDRRLPDHRPQISAQMMRELLTSISAIGIPAGIAPDQNFLLDSLGRTWFAHEMSERHGITVDPADTRLSGPTSINGLTDYVCSLAASSTARD